MAHENCSQCKWFSDEDESFERPICQFCVIAELTPETQAEMHERAGLRHPGVRTILQTLGTVIGEFERSRNINTTFTDILHRCSERGVLITVDERDGDTLTFRHCASNVEVTSAQLGSDFCRVYLHHRANPSSAEMGWLKRDVVKEIDAFHVRFICARCFGKADALTAAEAEWWNPIRFKSVDKSIALKVFNEAVRRSSR